MMCAVLTTGHVWLGWSGKWLHLVTSKNTSNFYNFITTGLKEVLGHTSCSLTEIQETIFSIDYRERRSHARGVYLIQYTSRMETARVKYEEGADT